MEISIKRKQTAFRLRSDLLDKLKIAARQENRSVNNFVENVLMQYIQKNPNKETLDAMKDASEGRFAGEIDMTSLETFKQSIEE